MARILVVEDDPILRFTLAEWLRLAGHDVMEAISADEANVILASIVALDLVITDVQMPGTLDGLALTRAIRAMTPPLPVILVSGHALPDESAALGAAAFFAKPYKLEELAERVAALMAERHSDAAAKTRAGNGG
jgi:CheY-like chemotaxis protein